MTEIKEVDYRKGHEEVKFHYLLYLILFGIVVLFLGRSTVISHGSGYYRAAATWLQINFVDDDPEHAALLEDLNSLTNDDFEKAREIIESKEGVERYYFADDADAVSIMYAVTAKDNLRVSEVSVDCDSFDAQETTRDRVFCQKHGREIRVLLRQKFPSLAKERPL